MPAPVEVDIKYYPVEPIFLWHQGMSVSYDGQTWHPMAMAPPPGSHLRVRPHLLRRRGQPVPAVRQAGSSSLSPSRRVRRVRPALLRRLVPLL